MKVWAEFWNRKKKGNKEEVKSLSILITGRYVCKLY